MTTLLCVDLFGQQTLLPIAAEHAVFPLACLCAWNVFRKEITSTMISICFAVKLEELVTVVTPMWWRRWGAYRALANKFSPWSYIFLQVSPDKLQSSLLVSWMVCSVYRFCSRHGPQAQANKPNAPTDLLNVAEAMMPRVFLRLIQYFRDSRWGYYLINSGQIVV